jgi:superfamily II DNA or RNA helicase
VIVDEAHRSVTPSMIKVYSHFKSPIILGFTATADRPDGISLSTIFSRIAYQYSMANGIRDGYLSPIIGKQVDDFEIDISKIAPRNGDYQDGPLAEALESYMDQIAEAIIRETDGRKKVLCFLPNVHSSMMLHEALERRGEKSDFVHGKKKNDQALSDFRRGKIKYLTSCQLVIEGYDEPEIDCIAMLRPTTSRIIYSQAVGRGTRIAKGKENMLLLEFTYNSSRLDLVSPYELIGEDTSHRVISELKKEKLDGDDIFERIQERAEKLQDVDYIVQKAFEKLSFSTFDPIDLAAILGVEVDTEAQVVFDGRELTGGVTTKQENYLSRFMIDSKDMTKAQASIMIQALVDKNAIPMGGVATNAQVKYLARLYPGVRMPHRLTKAAAAVLINTKIKKMEMA